MLTLGRGAPRGPTTRVRGTGSAKSRRNRAPVSTRVGRVAPSCPELPRVERSGQRNLMDGDVRAPPPWAVVDSERLTTVLVMVEAGRAVAAKIIFGVPEV